ncbi:MAG TPA: hypothetical protein VHV77_05855, partial [Pirellulales bacterium]|nr:hypothetical protein [Pirellulales bacterium]
LEWEKESLDVRVVEESSAGFTVDTQEPFDKKIESTVFLRFADRLCEVKIARVQAAQGGSRIGLQLVRDLKYGARQEQRNAKWKKRTLIATAVASAVTIAMLPWLMQAHAHGGLLSILPFYDAPEAPPRIELPSLSLSPEVRRFVREHEGTELLLDPEVSRLLGLTSKQREKLEKLAASPSSDVTSQAGNLLQSKQEWRLREMKEQSTSAVELIERVAKHWPRANARALVERLGPGALALKRVAGELKLTPDQRQAICDLMETELAKSDELYRRAKDQNSAELETDAKAVLQKARDEALSLLTPDQVRKIEAAKR